MKLTWTIIALSGLLLSCSQEPGPKNAFTLTNQLGRELKDASVVIKRENIKNYITESTDFTLLSGDSAVVPYQLDDLDGDGQWDEMALVIDLAAHQSVSMFIDVNRACPEFTDRAHARLGYSETRNDTFKTVNSHTRPASHVAQSKPFLYQFEGPGWESDKVAFRAYFDSRNGKDIFGKTTSKMVIDSIGLPMNLPEGNYHEIKPWGMDVLKVSTSLGAGAIVAQLGDSLHRIMEESAHYQLIADGPVRAMIELTYKGWKIGDKAYTAKERISIWAGQYAYQNELSLEPHNPDIKFVTGLVTVKTEETPAKWAKEGFFAISSHDQQSENHDYLGMAVVVPTVSFGSFVDFDSLRTDVIHTAGVRLKNQNRYYFVAGWEKTDESLQEKEQFEKLVLALGEEISSPVLVEF